MSKREKRKKERERESPFPVLGVCYCFTCRVIPSTTTTKKKCKEKPFRSQSYKRKFVFKKDLISLRFLDGELLQRGLNNVIVMTEIEVMHKQGI